jgi:nicotinate-nucleotide--dimethylbenzimidazole phosphoribosyltransferase
MIGGHQSTEPGHVASMAHLGLTPLIDMRMRLGEGTGAVLAMHLVDASARIINEMATFESAGVSNR